MSLNQKKNRGHQPLSVENPILYFLITVKLFPRLQVLQDPTLQEGRVGGNGGGNALPAPLIQNGN